MARDKSLPLAVVAVAVVMSLVGSAAVAQTVPPNRGAEPSSLAQAIRVAEQETAGRARTAELDRDKGLDVYEIKTVAKDRSAKVLVDQSSGKVVRVEGRGALSGVFDREGGREEEAYLAQLEALPMTLLEAVAAAERESGGRAVAAALKSYYGQTLFQVRVVKDFVPQKLMIDPSSGKVVTLAQPAHDDNH